MGPQLELTNERPKQVIDIGMEAYDSCSGRIDAGEPGQVAARLRLRVRTHHEGCVGRCTPDAASQQECLDDARLVRSSPLYSQASSLGRLSGAA